MPTARAATLTDILALTKELPHLLANAGAPDRNELHAFLSEANTIQDKRSVLHEKLKVSQAGPDKSRELQNAVTRDSKVHILRRGKKEQIVNGLVVERVTQRHEHRLPRVNRLARNLASVKERMASRTKRQQVASVISPAVCDLYHVVYIDR